MPKVINWSKLFDNSEQALISHFGCPLPRCFDKLSVKLRSGLLDEHGFVQTVTTVVCHSTVQTKWGVKGNPSKNLTLLLVAVVMVEI